MRRCCGVSVKTLTFGARAADGNFDARAGAGRRETTSDYSGRQRRREALGAPAAVLQTVNEREHFGHGRIKFDGDGLADADLGEGARERLVFDDGDGVLV